MIRREKSYRPLLSALLLLAVAMATSRVSALAALMPEPEGAQEYRAEIIEPEEAPVAIIVKQDLSEILQIAARYNGYELKFSSPVTGTVENASLPMRMKDLMPELAAMFDLKWHFSTSKLFVSTAKEQSERQLELNGLQIDELRAALDRSGISKDEYELRVHADLDTISVTGPASYLDGIALVLKELATSGGEDE